MKIAKVGLVSSSSSITTEKILKGQKLFAWAFKLIRSNIIKILPISYFNRPSDTVPLLLSDDAFKSSLPPEIHDFAQKNAVLKSVVQDDKGRMLILNEDAYEKRRTAISVGFQNDYWFSGVSLYLFQTIGKIKKQENGNISYRQNWDKHGTLGKEKFQHWAYQTINQAMRARLINIYNETYLATTIGHTYITESQFESYLLAMAGIENDSEIHNAANFLEANNSFISVESPEIVIELRTKYPTAFERFNYSLLYVAEELTGVEPQNFDKKAKILFHKKIFPQIDEIRNSINAISTGGVKSILSSLVGLSASIATGSTLPLIPTLMNSVANTLTETFPSISQHQRLRNRPIYIWHRLTRN